MKTAVSRSMESRLLALRLGFYAFAGLCILGAWLAARYWDLPLSLYVRDAVLSRSMARYGGFISQLGLMMWAMSGAVMLVTAFRNLTLKSAPGIGASAAAELGEEAYLLAGFGTLSLGLLFDDAFMIHELLVQGILRPFGYALFASYAGILCVLVFFSRERLKVNWFWLALPIGLLCSSFLVDLLDDKHLLGDADKSLMTFIEDSLKFVGIAGWCSYFIDRSIRVLCGTLTAPTSGRPSQSP